MSARKGSETEGAGHPRRSKKSNASDRKSGGSGGRGGGRGPRSGDLGRALRSVYDDTLREAVPDEFVNLIGKLN